MVLSFPFYACSLLGGHVCEAVPTHTPGLDNPVVQAKYSPAKPMEEQTQDMHSLKTWTTNMMRTGTALSSKPRLIQN